MDFLIANKGGPNLTISTVNLPLSRAVFGHFTPRKKHFLAALVDIPLLEKEIFFSILETIYFHDVKYNYY